MSLLERLRSGTDSTSTRLTVGVVAAVFIFWGIGSNDQRNQNSTFATVNGAAITDLEVREALRQRGGRLPAEQRDAILAETVEELVREEVLLQEAGRLGMRVSDQELADKLRGETRFQKDGAFDTKAYAAALKAMGTTRGAFEARVRRQLLLKRVLDVVAAGVDVPEAEVRRTWEERSTQLQASYVRAAPSTFRDDIVVNDAERDAWIAANGAKVEARYKELFERVYNLPKRVTASTILLRTDIPGADAAAVRTRLEALRAEAATGDMAALARRWSEDLSASDGGALGTQAAGQLDPAALAAIEKAGVGNVTEVVETPRGLQIFKVERIDAARVVPIEEARGEIAVGLIQDEKAPALLDAWVAQVRQAWTAADAPPTELLAAQGVEVDTTGGFSPADPVPDLGDVPGLRDALTRAAPGSVLPEVYDVRGTKVIVALAHRTDPTPEAWEAQQGLVRMALRAQAQRAYVTAWVDGLVAAADVQRDVPGAATPTPPAGGDAPSK
ncbi:MAG: hypothetical protein RLZZ299_98 [Pseudomonadota bacterium]|jgi:peptidyl-prolyl cis-trans isomerase D